MRKAHYFAGQADIRWEHSHDADNQFQAELKIEPSNCRASNNLGVCSLELSSFDSSRRRHTRYIGDWSSDVCSSDPSRRRYTRYIGDWSSDVCSSDLASF